MLLLIDNFDSFVHNLARYLRRLGQETMVVRNDAITCAEVESMKPQGIILSPGPCTPSEAGVCVDVVQQLHTSIPMLGVCLGHQAIAAAFGADVVRAPAPVHGRHSMIRHDGLGVFTGISSPTQACRYHSLTVDEASLPESLIGCAWSDSDGCLMAIRHRDQPLFGVQFHPESVLTPCGYAILANFVRVAGQKCSATPNLFDERPPEPVVEDPTGPPPIYY